MKKTDIFISYRRSSYAIAKIIELKLRTSGFTVFFDTESLHIGKFNQQLFEAIDNCRYFIIVLSPNALDRCCSEDDWVRLEIVHALESNKNIIPIIIDDFIWPNPMPVGLEELCNYQAVSAPSGGELLDMAIKRVQEHYLQKNYRPYNLIKKSIIFGCVLLMSLFIIFGFCKRVQNEDISPYCKPYLINFADSTLYEENGRFSGILLTTKDSLINYFALSISNNPNADAMYILGKMCMANFNLLKDRDLSNDALWWLKTSAELGNARAANELGRCYYNGLCGVGKSVDKAFKWFKESADRGNPEAMNNVGKCYHEGHGVRQSDRQAVKFYSKAEMQSYNIARYNLGIHYLLGKGVKMDIAMGLRLLKKAAENGSDAALLLLGDIYNENKDKVNGIEKNREESIKWYQKLSADPYSINKASADRELEKLRGEISSN